MRYQVLQHPHRNLFYHIEIEAAMNRLLVIYTKIMDRVVIMRNQITYSLGVNYSTETTQKCYRLLTKCSYN